MLNGALATVVPNTDRERVIDGSAIFLGDSRQLIKQLPSGHYHSCITSPPYWGKRDYGYDGQIGAEGDLQDYIDDLVQIFREVRRVLRDDGTLWLNLGDTYTSGNRGWRAADRKNPARGMSYRPATPKGLKPKDLIGLPWRVAFALQADGWFLRSDIVWHKPNCQPESVKDRPTSAHEYIFLFSKTEDYYYDAHAVREPAVEKGKTRNRRTVWSINTEPFPEAHFATFPEELVKPMVMASCPVDAHVLDPFFGAGTVGAVCKRIGRLFHGIELKEEYVAIATKRIAKIKAG